ncbi:MAG TPA: hypothetical protein VL463_19355 [Kofleriaceae bacterium]|nr:hypothetical protein [Kofleriaceae bacterium]
MPSAPGHAAVFAGLVPAVLDRLVEVRSSLDHGFARLDEAQARAQLEQILSHQVGFLTSGDSTSLRGFLRSYRALRAADGLGPENLLHAVTAIGDVTTQIIQRDSPSGARTAELVSSWVRVSWSTARIVVEMIAEELAGRVAQLQELES